MTDWMYLTRPLLESLVGSGKKVRLRREDGTPEDLDKGVWKFVYIHPEKPFARLEQTCSHCGGVCCGVKKRSVSDGPNWLVQVIE